MGPLHAITVKQPPILFQHNLKETPKDIFFIIDVVKHKSDEKVIPLVVAKTAVNVAVSKDHLL